MLKKVIFDKSTPENRHDRLWREGLLIDTEHTGNYPVHLYMLDNFFAKVVYSDEATKSVKEIYSFKNMSERSKSVSQIGF